MVLDRRTFIPLAVAVVAFFVIANVTYHHHRSLSNVAWGAFLIGAVLLIGLGVRAAIQSRRRGAS